MLQFFRRLVRSKVGGLIALLLLAAIAFGFAAADIQNSGSGLFGGTSATTAAKVGGETLSTAELESRSGRVLEANRANTPTLTADAFVRAGGVENVLGQLVDQMAFTAFAKDQGMRISKKLVDAEIARIPAFQGATGQFDDTVFRQLLARERISETALREDITRQLIERQILSPAAANAVAPKGMVGPYASMLLERREGRIALVPSAAFAPTAKPSEAQLRTFYIREGARFALPEQRKVRYAIADAGRFAGKVAPTDAEIATYYKSNSAQYAASETRGAEQLVLPSEAAAKQIAVKIGQAGSLAAAAKGAGLEVSPIAPATRNAFAAQTSDVAAAAVFAGSQGAIVGPVRTGIGWALYRVTAVNRLAAKPIDSVRGEIVAKLTATKTAQAMSDLSGRIDDEIGKGSTFEEVVKANGLTAAETPLLTKDGRTLGAVPAQPDPVQGALAKAAFGMEQDDDPQVIAIEGGQRLAVVAVGQTIAAGPPPLTEVRPLVEQAWALDQGAAKAKALADKLGAQAATTPLETLILNAGVKLPPVERIGAQRAQLGREGGQIPPPLIALFSMREGKTRVLPLDNDRGYILVHVDKIVPGDASRQQQVLDATRQGLSAVLSGEYSAQFRHAVRREVGVERNAAAIAKAKSDIAKGGAAR